MLEKGEYFRNIYGLGLVMQVSNMTDHCWVFFADIVTSNFDGMKWCAVITLEVISEI